MTNEPPEREGENVVRWAIIGPTVSHTGLTRHIVAGELMTPCKRLMIVRYPNQPGFFLFYCNEHWESVSDTWHETLDNALHQAEFEYQGINNLWHSGTNQ